MMNIFIREMKDNRRALIIWCVCMFLLVLSGMAKYTAYSSGSSMSDVLNKMPSAMKAMLGIESFDVTTMSGFFAFLFPYIELAAAIHAVLLGSSIIAKEERDKTTEFLIVKPVSRKVIISSKLLAALVNMVLVNLVSLFSSIVMAAALNKGKDISHEIVLFIFSMLLVQLIFMSLGALIAAYIRNAKSSGSLATAILLGSFVISKITDLTDRLNILNILSPFKYFSFKNIVNGREISFSIVLISILLAAVFLASTYYFYQKRDLV